MYVPANLPGKQAVPAGGRSRRSKLSAVRSACLFPHIVPYRRTSDVVLCGPGVLCGEAFSSNGRQRKRVRRFSASAGPSGLPPVCVPQSSLPQGYQSLRVRSASSCERTRCTCAPVHGSLKTGSSELFVKVGGRSSLAGPRSGSLADSSDVFTAISEEPKPAREGHLKTGRCQHVLLAARNTAACRIHV